MIYYINFGAVGPKRGGFMDTRGKAKVKSQKVKGKSESFHSCIIFEFCLFTFDLDL